MKTYFGLLASIFIGLGMGSCANYDDNASSYSTVDSQMTYVQKEVYIISAELRDENNPQRVALYKVFTSIDEPFVDENGLMIFTDAETQKRIRLTSDYKTRISTGYAFVPNMAPDPGQDAYTATGRRVDLTKPQD